MPEPTLASSGAAAAAAVQNVFARAGAPLAASELDRVLAGIALRGITLFRRAVERGDTIPLDLLGDMITAVSALRAALGMAPTPVNTEIYLGGWPR